MRENEYLKSKKQVILERLKKREFYKLRSILGNNWAMFFILLGGRQAGKSYAVLDYFLKEYKKKGTQFYWLRLTETQQDKLLKNNAQMFVDPDLCRKYNLILTRKGSQVYDHGKPMAKILALSNFYNDKGNGYYDNAYQGDYLLCLDEMNREQNERKTFDIVYAFVNQLENLVRNTKNKIRIFLIGNTLEEASELMTCFNFLPESFGRFKIKKKRAVVDYIEPSDAYKQMRKGSVADLLSPESSTFTNEIKRDISHITKRRLNKPSYIIKFDKENKFTVWDSNVVKKYCNEKVKCIAMRPYLDEIFSPQSRDAVINMFNARGYYFRDLITQTLFKKSLALLKPAQ